MKLSFRNSKQKNEQDKMILFVCVENAGRSQMAEGFFNHRYAPKGYRARSLAPALASGVFGNLWLYWTATFIGSSAVASIVRRKLNHAKK
jgi:Low molecular weight phosphotyrosine protein phosphatase